MPINPSCKPGREVTVGPTSRQVSTSRTHPYQRPVLQTLAGSSNAVPSVFLPTNAPRQPPHGLTSPSRRFASPRFTPRLQPHLPTNPLQPSSPADCFSHNSSHSLLATKLPDSQCGQSKTTTPTAPSVPTMPPRQIVPLPTCAETSPPANSLDAASYLQLPLFLCLPSTIPTFSPHSYKPLRLRQSPST